MTASFHVVSDPSNDVGHDFRVLFMEMFGVFQYHHLGKGSCIGKRGKERTGGKKGGRTESKHIVPENFYKNNNL